jgi:DNA anti-recombination protein RmuC
MLSSTVAAAGALAVLISAVTGFLAWTLSRRAQTAAERRQEAIDKAPYIERLQAWSERLMKETDDRRHQVEAECEERIARDRRECEDRITRLRGDVDRRLRDMEVQHGARVLAAERREDAWRRRALGEADDEEPPPRRRGQ